MAMKVRDGDEIILPAFTCSVVPYTILHCGARPRYVDIRDDYRMNFDSLRAAVGPGTKAIIAQHMFGLPERIAEIVTLANQRGIRVIEDCAHVLPGTPYQGRNLGTWGDAAYFSFERGKTLSSGWGGAAVTRDKELGQALREIQRSVVQLSRSDHLRIGKHLLLTLFVDHPNLCALGNLIRGSLARKGVIPNAMPLSEARGNPPADPLGRLADTQAALLLCQLQEIASIAERRRESVRMLSERLGRPQLDLPLMWYPLQVENADEAVVAFSQEQIELRRWEAPLTPTGCDMSRALYDRGSFPKAEAISRGCVALPTMLSKSDFQRVAEAAARHLKIIPTEFAL
jgi:dTDP-4-amino-4,6-dideoxygalactose transaminase